MFLVVQRKNTVAPILSLMKDRNNYVDGVQFHYGVGIPKYFRNTSRTIKEDSLTHFSLIRGLCNYIKQVLVKGGGWARLAISVLNLIAWNHITANINTPKRYKRATIKQYFNNLESLSKEYKTPPSKATSYMKFKSFITTRQEKDVFQLTCSDTKELSKTSLRYAGILLEFKPKKKPFSDLVGLDEDKNILWNKDLKWNEIYGNGLLASGKASNSKSIAHFIYL
ncbi:unnamed protein product [Mytilus coruscus]|uniref:Uncharacterized protein n=1 Tax=Mytilus coruscus TaxID=42192 RepID=A0A6J8DW66_MYTCO|nr:unnamed protein product [Mytilus coruscus]